MSTINRKLTVNEFKSEIKSDKLQMIINPKDATNRFVVNEVGNIVASVSKKFDVSKSVIVTDNFDEEDGHQFYCFCNPGATGEVIMEF